MGFYRLLDQLKRLIYMLLQWRQRLALQDRSTRSRADFKGQEGKTEEINGLVNQRMQGIHDHRTITRGKLSVFVADAWVIPRKILRVLRLEKLAINVENKGILVELAKELRNELLVLRTLHNNGMQMAFGV